MLHKTKGIVLNYLPYNDNFAIVTIYTEVFGRIAYLTANGHSKKTKVSRVFLQPLSVLDMEVEHLNTREIQRIREIKPAFIRSQVHRLPAKNAIALFLAEVLYRIIQEKEANQPLFDYLYRSIQWLELVDLGAANFHLTFLLQLSAFLGIRPESKTFLPGSFFDLRNGIFTKNIPDHNHFLNQNDSIIFERLLRLNYENMALYSFSRQERTTIIRHIIDYYRLHLPEFPEIKSLAVMQSVFGE